jgi:hypothetical protein
LKRACVDTTMPPLFLDKWRAPQTMNSYLVTYRCLCQTQFGNCAIMDMDRAPPVRLHKVKNEEEGRDLFKRPCRQQWIEHGWELTDHPDISSFHCHLWRPDISSDTMHGGLAQLGLLQQALPGRLEQSECPVSPLRPHQWHFDQQSGRVRVNRTTRTKDSHRRRQDSIVCWAERLRLTFIVFHLIGTANARWAKTHSLSRVSNDLAPSTSATFRSTSVVEKPFVARSSAIECHSIADVIVAARWSFLSEKVAIF